jgi:subtilisin family serine protease
MLDKVTGTKYGVAKKVNPVIVKVPGQKWTKEDPSLDEYLEGVHLTLKDIQSKGNGANAVISISWYYPAQHVDQDWIDKLESYITDIIKEGATVVVAAGNDGLSKNVDGYPAALVTKIPEMIVVGASMYSGERWLSASGAGSNLDTERNIPDVYAPGAQSPTEGIQMANCRPNRPYQGAPGTSPATASVAGLVAYFKGHKGFSTTSPSEIKDLILQMAYPRGQDEDVATVWNGMESKGESCIVMRDAEGNVPRASNFTDCLMEFEDSGHAKLF